LGRPETTGTVPGDPDKPIRIVVESISSRRREQLADVEADAAEDADVEELSDSAAQQCCVVGRYVGRRSSRARTRVERAWMT
jgi:hypothetical protein